MQPVAGMAASERNGGIILPAFPLLSYLVAPTINSSAMYPLFADEPLILDDPYMSRMSEEDFSPFASTTASGASSATRSKKS